MAEQEERIAARLRKLRADEGHPDRPGRPLPADKAAEKAAVKYRQWQRWERGRTMPRPASLEKVATAFGIDVAEFYVTGEAQPLSQLDRIEQQVGEVLALLRGESGASSKDAARAVGDAVARIGEAAGSRRKPGPARQANPRAARRRKSA